MKPISEIATTHKEVQTYVNVDDTSMQVTGPSWGELNNILTPCVLNFKIHVDAIKLKLSPKAAIVASYPCQSTLNKYLHNECVYFKVVKHHRDLGVTYSAALSRPYQLVQNRFVNAKTRVKKIKAIAKINKRAKNIFKSSYMAAAIWGHPACGIVPSKIISLERDALCCAGLAKRGRCRSTALVVHYGLLGAPMAIILREVFYNYCQVVAILCNGGYQDQLKSAWGEACEYIKNKQYPFNHIRGLMTNVIAFLYKLGWAPHD